MSAETWRRRYALAMDAAEAQVEELPPDAPWRLAFGFTNSVDRIVSLDGPGLAALARSEGVASPAPLSADRACTPAELVQSLLNYVQTGQGGEVWLGEPELGTWISASFRGRSQVGGAGIRAANTVAALGFAALLHVTNLAAEQAALIDGSGRVVIPTATGLRMPAAAVRSGDPLMEHFIFEFQSGTAVSLPSGTIVAPQANRVIVSLDPANLRQPIDPWFVDAVADPANMIRWVLISGFSQVADAAMCRARLAETMTAIARWRQKCAPPRIHLELGAMPSPHVLDVVLEQLSPMIDSIGLNADELVEILDLLELPAPDQLNINDTAAALQRLQARLDVPRLSLHTQHFCLTVSRFDPEVERQALLYGSLVARSFARDADFASTVDLRQTLSQATPSGYGLSLEEALPATSRRRDGICRMDDAWLVFVPTLAVSHPATTIGLGDSFTGGVLAML